jgi:hypothetical protein
MGFVVHDLSSLKHEKWDEGACRLPLAASDGAGPLTF